MFDTETTFVDPNTDDLDAFNDLLQGHAQVQEDTEEAATSEEEIVEDNADNEIEADTLATDTDTDDGESEDGEEEAEADPEPDPKPKKNSVQERINELTREKHEERRERLALQSRLDELLAKLEDPTPKTVTTPAVSAGPDPDALNEDGTDKYPLGEFDPSYIRDLTRFTIAEETKAAREAEAEEDRVFEETAAKTELVEAWDGKLETAKEKYPDLQEKNYALVDAFSDLDPAYGEYLASTIMSMDYGTDVLYHLATNLDEARRISDMGPAKAAIALGRIEARYELQTTEQKERKLKVSNAPVPPPQVNKGAASVATVVPDTDDLDAFETVFFKKRR